MNLESGGYPYRSKEIIDKLDVYKTKKKADSLKEVINSLVIDVGRCYILCIYIVHYSVLAFVSSLYHINFKL